MLHRLLQRQLRKVGLGDAEGPPDAAKWQKLLERISDSYHEADRHEYVLERSVAVSSEEMLELHGKLRERNTLLRQILSRYVAASVADDILSNPGEKMRLGGSSRRVSVLFLDIRGFTHFSEHREASTVVDVLNTVFARLVPIILDHRGTFDKFMGDCLMAFYGAPVSESDDALRAVQTAVRLRETFRCIQDSVPELGEVGVGIGICTGNAVVGNLGSTELMDYTVVGDTPNTAARLEQNAGPGQILICPETYRVTRHHLRVDTLPPLHLKGKDEPFQSYHVVDLLEPCSVP